MDGDGNSLRRTTVRNGGPAWEVKRCGGGIANSRPLYGMACLAGRMSDEGGGAVRPAEDEGGGTLLVTLQDRTEVPFLWRPPADEERAADQQVNVFRDAESYEAMASALKRARKEARVLREENERLRKEETSEDHALAALLATGAIEQTPFTAEETLSGKDPDAEIVAVLFRGRRGRRPSSSTSRTSMRRCPGACSAFV